MKNDIYKRLVEHVSKRRWVEAQNVVRSVMEQKVALRLEAERKLLQEPDEDEGEDNESAVKSTTVFVGPQAGNRR